MSDIKFENEEELVHLKSLGKKARSETQEARLLLLRVEKKRIQKVLSSRRLYQNLNDEQREKRRKAQKKWEQNLDEDHLKERQQKSNASRRRTGGRQVTPSFSPSSLISSSPRSSIAPRPPVTRLRVASRATRPPESSKSWM